MVTHKYTNLTNSIMHELCRGKKKRRREKGEKEKKKVKKCGAQSTGRESEPAKG